MVNPFTFYLPISFLLSGPSNLIVLVDFVAISITLVLLILNSENGKELFCFRM